MSIPPVEQIETGAFIDPGRRKAPGGAVLTGNGIIPGPGKG